MRHGFSIDAINLLNNEFLKRGIPPIGSVGGIAGVMGESGANLDPTSFNSRDPGGSGGIGQWNRGRLTGPSGMLAFAKNAGIDVDPSYALDSKKVPLAIQAQYLGHELDTTYKGVADELKSAKSPDEALKIWVDKFEDPADKAGAIAQRSQYIQPLMNTISPNMVPGTSLASVPAGPGGGASIGASAPPAAAGTPSIASMIGAGDWKGAMGAVGQNKSIMDSIKGLGGALGGGGGQQQPAAPALPPPPALQDNSAAIAQMAPQLMAQLIANQKKQYGNIPGLSLGGFGV